MPRALMIDDGLLDALCERWPNVPAEYPGQTLEAWLVGVMRGYNRYGYPEWGQDPDTTPGQGGDLWQDVVYKYPAATFEDVVARKAAELRERGGTLVRGARDLRGLALAAIRLRM